MVHRGLAPSRESARAAIEAGRVTVGGAPADKPARLVDAAEPVLVAAGDAWASRGGAKLDAALTRWPIEVDGSRCLDAGASTGGFTDVLLTRGAREVVAVDVGRGQLLDRLRHDPRVTVVDRTNIRTTTLADLGSTPFGVVVADLSFISLRTVAPVLTGELASPGAELVWLVKPQFEAGRAVVARGKGVVRDPDAWRGALVGVGHAIGGGGAAIMGAMASPLRGSDGNVEFLVWARAHHPGGLTAESAADMALDDLARDGHLPDDVAGGPVPDRDDRARDDPAIGPGPGR